jgi:hypothetical protein
MIIFVEENIKKKKRAQELLACKNQKTYEGKNTYLSSRGQVFILRTSTLS